MKRVFIVEDQTAVRQMLPHVLDVEVGHEVIGESGEGHDAVKLI
jgi:YesN/AraC family two-component response regulator